MAEHWSLINFMVTVIYLCISLVCKIVLASILHVGDITPGFEGTQMTFIDRDGVLLASRNGEFNFQFAKTANDSTLFLLSIVHVESRNVIWVANRGNPVSNSDKFVFDKNGDALLQRGRGVVWSSDTGNKGVSSMELRDDGNLVLLGNYDGSVIWQSFAHPTDTLLPTQEFTEGMRLVSEPGGGGGNSLRYVLKIEFGDAVLSAAGSRNSQPYWSMRKDSREIDGYNRDLAAAVASAMIIGNSWRFYDKSKSFLWQFNFTDDHSSANETWILVLGSDGVITFVNLRSSFVSKTRIPSDYCSTPEPCDPYNICSGGGNGGGGKCTCASVLRSHPHCEPGLASPCDSKTAAVLLVRADGGLDYFALRFLNPLKNTDLSGCRDSCGRNCSCLALFFHGDSGNCFLLDWIGSFQKPVKDSGFVAYIKVSINGGESAGSGGRSRKELVVVVIIVVSTLLVISVMIFAGVKYYQKNQDPPERDSEEDESFYDNLTSMPVRYSYSDLETATSNFSVKLGEGGFGSVYKGVLPNGTELAVKKLEGIGQGKKEFRVEVSIIGSIHHHHLVRLKGFCAEGTHRLLVYEYMSNGSLDKWIFNVNKGEFRLDWDTRFNIALGTAKGLAYLHQDCESKIVHCDIKPENVLLTDNFLAKVSDFGLAKLMTREQSHVFTTLRGTRGYLAPEWLTSYAISEKSDVYSYGMVLLEIVGGRKNFDPSEGPEKSHFPAYTFKMMEEGNVRGILDSNLGTVGDDLRVETVVKVALWCIQEDMSLRPSMTKVVQMLEGVCDVPNPPACYFLGSRIRSAFSHSTSEGGTSSSGPSESSSAVRNSGPR